MRKKASIKISVQALVSDEQVVYQYLKYQEGKGYKVISYRIGCTQDDFIQDVKTLVCYLIKVPRICTRKVKK